MAIPDIERIRLGDPDDMISLIRHYRTFSTERLKAALAIFNEWGWPEEILGPPPTGWKSMPRYKKPWMPDGTITRADYIKPCWDLLHIALDRTFTV